MENHEELGLIEMDSDARKRRSSTGILKAQKPRNPFKEVDFTEPTPNVNKSRRVSFASSNFVKPFSSDADKVTVWDATYEEEVEHTDSTQSSREQTESKSLNTFNTSTLNSLLDYQDSSTEEIVHIKQPPVEVPKIWISDEDSINERCSGKKIVEECVHPVVSDSLNKENFNPLINDISLLSGTRNTVKASNFKVELVQETNETSSKRNIVHFNESSSDMEMTTNLSVKCSISRDSTKNIKYDTEDMEFTQNLPFVINESQNNEIENTSKTSDESLANMEFTKNLPIMNENVLIVDDRRHSQHFNDGMEFTQNVPAIINEQINKIDLGYTKKEPLLICNDGDNRVYKRQSTALNKTTNEMEITNLFAKSITEGKTYNRNTKDISDKSLESMECTKNLPIMNLSCKFNIDDRRYTQLYNAELEFTKNLDISENKEEIETVLKENNVYSKIETSNESLGNMEFTKNLPTIIKNSKSNIDNRRHTQHYNEQMEFTQNLPVIVNENKKQIETDISHTKILEKTQSSNESLVNMEFTKNLSTIVESSKSNIDNRRCTQHYNDQMECTQNLDISENKNKKQIETDMSYTKTLEMTQSSNESLVNMEFTKNLSTIVESFKSNNNRRHTQHYNEQMEFTQNLDISENKEEIETVLKENNVYSKIETSNESLGNMEFTKNLPTIIKNSKSNIDNRRHTQHYNEQMEFTQNFSVILNENKKQIETDISHTKILEKTQSSNESLVNMEFTKNLSTIVESSNSNIDNRRRTQHFNEQMEFTQNLPVIVNKNKKQIETDMSYIKTLEKTESSNESLVNMEFTKNLSTIVESSKSNIDNRRLTQHYNDQMECTQNLSAMVNKSCVKSFTKKDTSILRENNLNFKNEKADESSDNNELTQNLPIMNESAKYNIDNRRYTQHCKEGIKVAQNLPVNVNKNSEEMDDDKNMVNQSVKFSANLSSTDGNKIESSQLNKSSNEKDTVSVSGRTNNVLSDKSMATELIENVHITTKNTSNYGIGKESSVTTSEQTLSKIIHSNKSIGDLDSSQKLLHNAVNMKSTTHLNSQIIEDTPNLPVEDQIINKNRIILSTAELSNRHPKAANKEHFSLLSGNNSNLTKTLTNLSQNNSNIIYSEPMKIKVNTNLECITEQHADLLQPFDNDGSIKLNTSGLKTPFKSFQMTLSNGNLSPSIEDTQHLINVRISEPNPESTNNSMLNEAQNKSLLSGKCEEDNPLVQTFANYSNMNREVIAEQIVEFRVPNFTITETFTKMPYFNNSNTQEVPNKLKRLSIEDIKNVVPCKKINLNSSVSEESMEVDEKIAEENIELLFLDSVKESDILDNVDPFFQESFSEEESNISLPKVNIKIFKDNLITYDFQDDSQLLKEIEDLRKLHRDLNTYWETNKNLFEGDLLPPLKLPDVQLISNLEESEEDAKVEDTDTLPKIDNCMQNKIITLTEQILDKAERSQAWQIDPCKMGEDSWVFSSFQRCVKFLVVFHFETGIVSSIETTNNLNDSCSNFCFYLVHVFRERLGHTYLKTVLGYRYDILTLLDYVEMLVDELTKHHIEMREMQCKYGLEVSRDNIFSFKILNRKLIISWNITVNMTNIHHVSCKDITAKSNLEYGEQVNEEHIQSLANRCSKGTSFLRNFIDNILEYVAIIEKRKTWRKQK